MSLTLANSNYNGSVLEQLYLVTGVGNQVVQKGACALLTDIAGKKALPRLSQTSDPIGDYTDGAPGSQTATTTYAERELVMNEMTVYETFIPSNFHGELWDKWQSRGDFTNLELNAELMNGILALYKDGIGTQLSKLFWQGDKTSLTTSLDKLNGIVTRAIADANCIEVTPAGNITDQNFMDILAACWAAIPDHLLDDPDFVLHVNTTDWKTMQAGNTKLKEAFTGVFGMSMETMYNTNKIKHFSGMPRHNIIGAKATTNESNSNLFMGVWVDPDSENVLIDKVANNSRTWFLRIDFKADVNYRLSTEVVYYKPV